MPIMIEIDKYSISPAVINLGTRGSAGVETLVFRFSPEWGGLTKRITFFACEPELTAPFLIPLDDVLPLPSQATAASGSHIAVIDGTDGAGKVIYTVDIICEVEYHADAGTETPPPPAPSEWQQFVGAVKEDRTAADAAAEQAAIFATEAQGAAEQAGQAQAGAEEAAEHYPIIQGGTWWVYDPIAGTYTDTRQPSTGAPPELLEATNEDIDDIFRDFMIQEAL